MNFTNRNYFNLILIKNIYLRGSITLSKILLISAIDVPKFVIGTKASSHIPILFIISALLNMHPPQ